MEKNLENYIDYKVKTVQKIDNSYGFRVYLYYRDGSKKIQQRAGFETKKEAEEERYVALAGLKNRTYLVYGNVLFKDYIMHWLEDDIKVRTQNYNTYDTYRRIMKKHIIPVLGNKRMYSLNVADITRLYSKVFDHSEAVAKQVKVIVNCCLKYGVRERALSSNVANGVELPRGATKAPYRSRVINADKTLNHEQILKLIEGSKGTPIYMMVLFNVIMGLRCSEILGVKYEDVDYIKQKLKVKRQLGIDINKSKEDTAPKTYTKQEKRLKTASSYRELDIPDIVFEAILQEKKQYEKNKNRRKKEFQDLGYICCSTYGRPRSKGFHYQWFKKILKEQGLPDLRWHDLRSTAATVLLQAGFSPKAVSRRFGHSSEILTVDYYGDNRKIAAIKLDRLEDYIEMVRPDDDQKEDCTNVKIDTDKYFR